ncbi:hypothetical protein M501DRAFT_1017833 [Patellaria atrata CBS 101060]|uniref:Zn(2)-C6 fungal-type domain-containing protein n=1 Tax=Patellaria atrata CBS 101060 TaxID=1346257 RepID=A0A9P4S9C9_9PEZI|nr:hypothetical protein M501DRAFT_1017833 [Patellaria atrata CBS 101060]
MTTPDSDDGDASPEPDYSPEQDSNEMAQVKDELADGDSPPTKQDGTSLQKHNAKDPHRPRRKKARRACFACQRAHLTCGDERPCQRCIKRGLSDQCHDGVRKKAKYLHDAPNESLMSGIGGNYHNLNGAQAAALSGHITGSNAATSVSQQPGFYPQAQAGNYTYVQNSGQGQMPPPMQDISSYGNQQYSSSQQNVSAQGVTSSMPTSNSTQMNQFSGPLFDPSDPALYNFDIASLNFGNHYGALEFGMLGHMSSGAAETPPGENQVNSMGQISGTFDTPITTTSDFTGSPQMNNMMFGANGLSDWNTSHSTQNSAIQMQTPQATPQAQNLDSSTQPHAYAIGAGPSSLSSTSPGSTGHDLSGGYETGPASPAIFTPPSHQGPGMGAYGRGQQKQPASHPQTDRSRNTPITLSSLSAQYTVTHKPRRDTSVIYTSIREPYSYESGFHRLLAVIRRRFPQKKVAQIAKALALFRPSFIACHGDLNRHDLIFMEQNFQRSLWSYEEMYLQAYGTPALICRRTGEVAAVNKEFSILTGWKRNVLLGTEPNLNINTGGTSGSDPNNKPGAGAAETPRLNTVELDTAQRNRPQPVFLAELLDDDDVVTFYEDFAKLAFTDPSGKPIRNVRLLKYRTNDDGGDDGTACAGGRRAGLSAQERAFRTQQAAVKLEIATISGEAGMNALGEREGKVRCMCTWEIKRNVFEMPMLIVINVGLWLLDGADLSVVFAYYLGCPSGFAWKG